MKQVLTYALFLFALILLPHTALSQIPKDALYTVYCRSFTGPMRAAEAKVLRDKLAGSDMKHWHVMHQESESTLYYGYYKSISDDSPREAQRAQNDLKKIKDLRDADDRRVFPLALLVPIPQPGSEGPPEWDLANTSPDRFWTILAGVYFDHPERKRAAVAAVQALRDDGREAYYYHDASSSLVCIGAWPRGAIKEQESDVATVPDPDVEVVAFNVPLPDDVPREFINAQGKRVRVFAPKIDVLDPDMRQAMNKNAYFMTNGVVLGREVKDARTGKKEVLPHRSALMMIPRKDRPAQPSLPPDVARRLVPGAQPQPQAPGTGTLRRLED